MNLCHFYPSLYWKCACLSVDAGAINEEDYYELVDSGIVDLSDEDDVRAQNKVNYGKVASAIIKARETIGVELPDINVSRLGFTPDEDRNVIVYGIRGIARVGEQIIKDIIINRPYNSLDDFIAKMVSADGKKLISKDKVVNLIKAGAFDNIENKPREEILKNYILSVADQKQKLNLQNFAMLIKQKMLPQELDFSVKVYNFTKYIRTMRYMGNYILDEFGYSFFSENYDLTKVNMIEKDGQYVNVISSAWWDNVYDAEMNKPRAYIKTHHDELLEELNTRLFNEEYNKYANGGLLQWELDSLNFYYSGHPLQNLIIPTETTLVKDLKENEFDGFWMIKGKQVPKYKLRSIVGTVIDKDKVKGLVTLQTTDGVIDIKVFKQQYARFDHTITDVNENGDKIILEESFFEKGTHLLVTGILRGTTFTPKTYKDTGFDPILKIVTKEDGSLDYFIRKSE